MTGSTEPTAACRSQPASSERARPREECEATVEDLILDLLEWLGPNPRPYAEVLEAWRTSCPRLPVWEDASDRGFIARRHEAGRGALVSVSAAGAEHLRERRRAPARTAAVR